MRELRLRVERADKRKAYTDSFVAATFTFPAHADQPASSWLYVGRLQQVLVVPIGKQQHTLLSVLWFREMVEDERLPGLLRVRVGGASPHTDDLLIEARRIDSQVWLTSIPNQPAWRHVHFKTSAAHTIPEHLLPHN